MSNPNEFLWCEKYRPQKLDDCILPDNIKDTAKGFIAQGRLPNFLFSGGAGVGKTTVAKALCNEVGADWILINASNENGVDVLRTKITQFASTSSFEGNKKVVILDEADHITTQAQAGLRAFIEQFSSNCTFILTCNFKSRLIEPIHSRCKTIDFRITNKDKPTLASQFFKRVSTILTTEGVEFDKKVIAEVINKHFPDFRRVLNELQSYAAVGKIDSGILVNLGDESFESLIKSIKDKKFGDMRKWVTQHADDDPTGIFQALYDKAVERLEGKSIPQLILLLAQYQYQSAFVANQEINTAAFLTELLMADLSWK